MITKYLSISSEDILQQVKLSYQIPELIKAIITRKVIVNAAIKANIQIETEELQQTADTIRLMNNLPSAKETWAWLQQHCLSLDDFQEIARISITSEKLAQHLFADQVEAWFVEHQLDYAGAVIYEVVLDSLDLAMELFYGLQEAEISFLEVARQYIQDKELCRQGGYRGIVRRHDLKPEISAAVFAAKPPEIIKPVITSNGIHLILVEELIQPQLTEKLCNHILSDLFSEWLDQQIEEFEVLNLLESSTRL